MDRGQPWAVGDWCWHSRQATPCRILDRQEMWGDVVYRVWLPTKDAVIRVRSQDLGSLDAAEPTVNQILHTAAAAKLLDALEDNLLLAPMQSSVVPLPHQLHALNRAIGGSSGGRIRFLLADEVGLGKTVEAGLILRELKLRGLARRILVVAPKGLVRQWQAEMRLHFGESFRPWNPMRVEQRIGRVDRIGQRHVVRATNFVLEDTVELRVRQVLEEKLELIAKEFGVDKAADVMDSVDTEPLVDALYLSGIQDPASIDRECDAALDRIRDKMAESRIDSALLAEGQLFSTDDARRWRDHPAQFWLERAITTGLPVFVNDQGRTFMPTARRIWDLLLTEEIRVVGLGCDVGGDAQQAFGVSREAATSQGEQIFAGLLESHQQRIREARARARDAFDSRWQALGRIGLPEVRAYRRRRLE
ncbi:MULTISPECIES: SNF2-related protein [unclassified Thiocapsa]|uniref:SNF2-related protein n=1 Tax=unclassified Thiocapsa TaxID=2641286 RepID=UPI0035B0507D